MLALAREHLAAFESGAGRLPASLRPAFLPVALTRAYLDRIEGHEQSTFASVPDISESGSTGCCFAMPFAGGGAAFPERLSGTHGSDAGAATLTRPSRPSRSSA